MGDSSRESDLRLQTVEAQAYEQALRLATELCERHQAITWDVTKIAELLAYQAKLWEQIRTTRRHKPEYYRVVRPAHPELPILILRRSMVTSDLLFAKARSTSSEASHGSSLPICKVVSDIVVGIS